MRIGLLLGFALSLSLFLSNFVFSERFEGGYLVKEVRQGKGIALNLVINTTERENVHLYAMDIQLPPTSKDVKLSLYRGWLSYYYGKRT